MKKIYRLCMAFTIFNAFVCESQALNTGDVVIIGYGVDIDVTPSVDEFSWLPLVDLVPGTKIYFTDSGYNAIDNMFMGNGLNDEILMRYTVPAGGIAAGTVMTVTEASIPADYAVIAGTQFGTDFNGLLTLTNSGDQVLAFQSTDDDSVPASFGTTNFTPLFMVTGSSLSFSALNTNTAGINPVSNVHNVTNLPPGLTAQVNAVAVGSGPLATDESDNARYEGLTTGTRDEILFAVSQLSNWARYDAAFGNDIEFGTVASGWSSNGVNAFTVNPLSVSPDLIDNQIIVGPNPAKDMLYIRNSSGKDIRKADVIDMTGKSIKTLNVNSGQLDVSEIAAGVYILRLDIDGSTIMKRIVVE
ncbi:T9SS type A sorting domain-containing protein [Flavobacterium pallidum]|uniref:Secretion system C-terminal sorting domain-containing protein n=1 Tax=Flavobacterium pallidum TaxID=2172098 RepID=A0A2S1SH87_9FLAO|nr:T9SS type A sorting domain-containing protein [Flavobacterium pallidum]AWI25773.1 hypothetical protein HYN49_07590 [Flavobacterium pallidum]